MFKAFVTMQMQLMVVDTARKKGAILALCATIITLVYKLLA